MSLSILILSRYTQLGASSRLRLLQYVPHLESLGAQVTVAPMFEDAYLENLYRTGGNQRLGLVAKSYWRRVCDVIELKKYSVVWVEKEVFPFLPGVFESLLVKSAVPYVVDYDDAIFHNYDLHSSRAVRFLLGSKLKSLLSGAAAVTAGNAYLADYARQHGAHNVHIIPTVVDVSRYRHTPEPADETFRIGWIGSPSTAQYLSVVLETLRRVAQARKIVLVTIGAVSLDLPRVPLERHAWSLDAEAKLLESIHVGIMPLRDSPWERGKCGYKLIQYMASGRPVVASPVGVNAEIVTPDVGILAGEDNAWFDTLIKLANQPELRQRLGKAARARVEHTFALHVTAPKIAGILEDAARERC